MSKSLNLYLGTAAGIGIMLLGAANFSDRFVAPIPDDLPRLGGLSADALAKLEPQTAATVVEPAEAAPEAASTVETAEAGPVEGGLISAANAQEGNGAGKRFGLGREALPEEIAAWNLEVSPDAAELPEGSGSVEDGEMLFVDNCAVCHGDFAEGVGNWPALAGGEGTLADEDPVKTVGSYWPYLSTAWDYVHRSMPYGNAQSLTADETYAIVAYILYSNWIVEDDFVLSNENFLDVEMPNADGFIVDDRPETEYGQWRTEPCMENCKEDVQITMRATVLDVTPEEESDQVTEAIEDAKDELGDIGAEAEASAESADAEDAAAVAAGAQKGEVSDDGDAVQMASAEPDPELVAEGEAVFRKCKACHQVGDGAKNRTGPHLNGIVGRDIGALEDFRYSATMAEMDGAWTPDELHAFLADPRGYAKGTKMAFAGLKSDEEIEAVTAYLSTFDQ